MPSNNRGSESFHQCGIMIEALRRFIFDDELPRRRLLVGAETAEAVLRYGAFVGSAIERHKELERAMDRARVHIVAVEESRRSVNSGMVIMADMLSRSRGRFGRAWHAPAGGLWGCLIHANTLLPESHRLVSLAVGVACCEAVRQMGCGDASIRWVNDVLIGGKKVAGFLIQGFSGPKYRDEYDLIGFGINVNNRSFPDDLRDTAVSLAEAVGSPVDLSFFTMLFLAKLCWNLGLLYFEEARRLKGVSSSGAEGGHPLLDRWKELSDTVGRQVVYGQDIFKSPLHRAEVIGIENDGSLLLQLEDGSNIAVQSGEVRY